MTRMVNDSNTFPRLWDAATFTHRESSVYGLDGGNHDRLVYSS